MPAPLLDIANEKLHGRDLLCKFRQVDSGEAGNYVLDSLRSEAKENRRKILFVRLPIDEGFCPRYEENIGGLN